MAGIDKMNEFYISANRFGFLASCYRPEDLPKEINQAMDILIDYFSNDIDFKKKSDEAHEWFDKNNEELEMFRKKDLLKSLLKECSK